MGKIHFSDTCLWDLLCGQQPTLESQGKTTVRGGRWDCSAVTSHNNRSMWMMKPIREKMILSVGWSKLWRSRLEGIEGLEGRGPSAGRSKQAVWGEHSRRCPRYSLIKPLHTLAHSKNYKCLLDLWLQGRVRKQKVQTVNGFIYMWRTVDSLSVGNVPHLKVWEQTSLRIKRMLTNKLCLQFQCLQCTGLCIQPEFRQEFPNLELQTQCWNSHQSEMIRCSLLNHIPSIEVEVGLQEKKWK